jgi:hypothetical protein
MIDGFFRMAYTGMTGSGFGLLVFQGGSIAGADVSGGTYNGTYTENPSTGAISIQVTMALPAGVAPVQSGVVLAAPISVPIAVTISPADISSEKTVLLQTPLGPVNATFKKIRDIP